MVSIFSEPYKNIYLGTGDDTVILETAGRYYITDEGGDDKITLNAYSSDIIWAGDGNDTIRSGAGDDIVSGGNGNDVIYNGSAFFTDYTKGRLYGGAGNDGIFAGIGRDELHGDEDNDALHGGLGIDTLYGGSGDDTLMGSSPLDRDYDADYLYGGTGDDTYQIDKTGNDTLYEKAGEGTDTVVVSLGMAYELAENFENLSVMQLFDDGPGGNVLTGNSVANKISGLTRDDTLSGGKGNDTLNGYAGNDFLNGGEDDDNLIGGAGSDTMLGGTGNDFYVVADASDKVVEKADEGIDTVTTALDSMALVANVENLTFVLTPLEKNPAPESGTGNGLNNVMTGSDAATSLFGFQGDDTLNGMGDNDKLFGGEGKDVLDGGANEDILSGDAGDDKLYGGAGNDALTGGAGADRLEGGDGADRFIFTKASDSVGVSADKIVGFDFGKDRIDLSDIDADTTVAGNQSFHFVGTSKPMFTSAGDLWTEVGGAGIRVCADTNGDGVADFTCAVYGIDIFSQSFAAADFML